MPTPTLDTTADGALVIEADTAVEALDHVRIRLGEDARIIDSRKVHRGGWKGFFTLERVQLTAMRADSAVDVADGTKKAQRDRPLVEDAEPDASVAQGPASGVLAHDAADGLTAVLERLMREAEGYEDRTFQDVLLAEVAAQQPVGAASPTPAVAASPTVDRTPAPVAVRAPAVDRTPATVAAHAPAVDPTPAPAAEPAPWTPPTLALRVVGAPSGQQAKPTARPAVSAPSGVAWQIDDLEELRLPRSLLTACRELDPMDECAWLSTISAAVVPWCRPLPQQDTVLVGPRAHRLGRALGVPVTQMGGEPAAEGTIALRANDADQGRRWVDQVIGDRWLHLVAGGSRWHAFLFDDALAVSWVGAEALPAALSVVSQMGLVLGFGLANATGPTPVRATPLDVALTIRSLLPRR